MRNKITQLVSSLILMIIAFILGIYLGYNESSIKPQDKPIYIHIEDKKSGIYFHSDNKNVEFIGKNGTPINKLEKK